MEAEDNQPAADLQNMPPADLQQVCLQSCTNLSGMVASGFQPRLTSSTACVCLCSSRAEPQVNNRATRR